MNTRESLQKLGYAVVPAVLSEDEIRMAKSWFHEWLDSVNIPQSMRTHGIFKHHEIGHQKHAWYVRTRPKVREVFAREVWDTSPDNLVVSFDGSCYIPGGREVRRGDSVSWTHTDQSPTQKGRQCVQGFVALTSNKTRSLVVYEGTHLEHQAYFSTHPAKDPSKRFQKIDSAYLHAPEMRARRKVVEAEAGSLVLWDSRTFHQNQYGVQDEGERLVQYVCYMPRDGAGNTDAQTKKRLKYFEDRRTTSHWPYPISVNGKQPQRYGNDDLLIDYSSLPRPDLHSLMNDIVKLI